ncbi:hypothetical protein P43SY_001539 [Pythium insidiosum]|uniref:Uncharacterized protein n=1 Tax=Pythium insidiosum TaxID=114742 RepID=A0AAD5M179_PYTIN|nr:hypothetical protein P43SY_001539 [Pythium insidiosum]
MGPHIAAFWNRGMVVIDNFLDEEAIKAAVCSLAFAPIFLRVDSEEMDPNRLMASVPMSGQLSAINVKMKELASRFTDDWEISAWTALKSLPGCRYDEENLRLYCYLRVKDVAQLPNATEAVAFATFLC